MSNRKQPRNSSGNRSKPTAATQRASAERAAAARARIEQAHRRRRLVVVGSVGAAVILVLAILVVVRLAVDTGPKSGQRAAAANNAVVTDVTSVPAATLNQIGAGTVRTLPKAISAPALTADGKPRILYVGAEYCPFCAAERWAVTVALSRFGTFSGLGQTASSPSDVYPDTATLTFHGASLRSDVVSFTGKELQSNQVDGDSYATLDKLTAAENTLVEKYNAPPYVSSKGAIPFMDIGGRYVLSGASYDPQVLAGKSHAQIASALKDPSSAIAKAVDGTANVLTAAICRVTNGKPATVCSSAGVTAAAGKLGST